MRTSLNHPASGNGAVASLFHFERLGRAVPEPGRWECHGAASDERLMQR
jgi:hypothetical protein